MSEPTLKQNLPESGLSFSATEDDIRSVANSSDQTRYMMAQLFPDTVRQLKTSLAELASLRSQLTDSQIANKWVDCKQELPAETDKKFWCRVIPLEGFPYLRNFDPYVASVNTYTTRGGEIRFNCGAAEQVTHWMPLPKPPAPPDVKDPPTGPKSAPKEQK